ncbi:PD-(D/E)XK nuclease family protein [Candidatus Micrarchaeota archaeon]|nr:PD-(D/E)XK nuclease family protein [Candidatus Micrarchaeota archaeon]
MTTYSYSRLNAFKSCPFAYKLSYLDRVPAPDRVELFTGKKVHETLEKLYSDLLQGKNNSLEELLAFHERQWNAGWNNSIVVQEGAKAEDFRSHGENCVKNYYSSHAPFNHAQTVGVERKVFTKLGRHSFVGVVDRIASVEGKKEVHDYKTASSLPSEDYFREDTQLPLYQLALQRQFGWQEVELVWDFVALDKEVRVKKSPASLEKAERDTVSLIEAVEETVAEGDFEKNEGSQCRRCVYAKHCGK